MSELSRAQLEPAIRAALPLQLQGRAAELTAAILGAIRAGREAGGQPEIDPSLLSLLETLGGKRLDMSGAFIEFGAGSQMGDVKIGDVVGGDLLKVTLVLPEAPAPWRLTNPADVDACPYPGLAVFNAESAPYFFGRDADIARLVRESSRPVVAITGPSGVGKSSFVLAGVLPHLRAQNPGLTSLVFRVSTSAELLRDLAATLAAHTGQPAEPLLAALQSDDTALRESLLAGDGTGRVVLVLDQFEELFVGADKARAADRARLLDLLLDIERTADPRLLVILTSRENFLEHADYLARPELRPILLERAVALAGLSDRQLREAIQRPLDAFNARPERRDRPAIAFETGVLDLFEQEFRRTERTLPLVQYLLRLLWTERRELSVAAYTQLGGLERALDRHASKIYESFAPEEQRLVRAVLLALVRPGIDGEYTRRRVARDELIGGGAQHDRVAAVVGRLASQDSRIISEQQVGQVSYLELTHEILLRQWERLRLLIDTFRERLELRERLLPVAEQWQQSLLRTGGRGDSTYLYRGSQLGQARDYTRSDDTPEGVDTSIKACYLASQRYQRRQVITATAALVATVVVLTVGFNWFTADQRAQLAAEQQLSSQRATAQVLAEQTAQAEAVQRTTAQAQAAQEAERAARESEVANSQRLTNQARQVFAGGDRPLALALALAAAGIPDPPIQVQHALAEIAYAPGFASEIGSGLAISPDGTRLLDVENDGRVLLRDLAVGATQELGQITLDSIGPGEVSLPSIQFSADGDRVVVGNEIEIRSWRVADGAPLSQYTFSASDPGPRSLSISPYQETFLMIPRTDAQGNYTDEIQLRDLRSGRVIQRLPDTDVGIFSDAAQVGAFAPDGRHILVGGGMIGPGDERPINGNAVLWDTQTGEVLGQVSGVSDSLVFGAGMLEQDGMLNFAYAGDDDTIYVWRYTSYNRQLGVTATLPNARGPLLWSQKQGFIIAASSDNSGTYLWNLDGSAQLLAGAGKPAALLANDTQLALERGGMVVRYDLANAAQLAGQVTPAGRADYIGTYSVLTSPDGDAVLTGDNQPDSVEFFYRASPDGERRMLGHGYLGPATSADRSVTMLSMLPQSFSAGQERRPLPIYQLVDMRSGEIIREVGVTPFGSVSFASYPPPAISADGAWAVALLPVEDNLRSIVIPIDLVSGRELPQLGEAALTYARLAISPDGKTALVLSGDARGDYGALANVDGPLRLLVWNVDNATLRGTLDAGLQKQQVTSGSYSEPTGLAYSPDGSMFAVTAAGGELRVWNARTLQELWRAPTTNNQIVFSPDSRLLLSGGRDGPIQLFDARSGALERSLNETRGPAIFSDDGTLLITGDSAQQVRVWDVASGGELRRFPIYSDLLTLAVAADGKSFFTGSADGMKQWRYDSLAELITWAGANREVAALSCEQRIRYQVLPLCPAGANATVAPTVVVTAQQSPAAPAPSSTPAVAPATPTTIGVQEFAVEAQNPLSSLRVVGARQSATAFELIVEYLAVDTRKVGIERPGLANAFFLQVGSERYPLRDAQGIVIGETTQTVAVGEALRFTLIFEPLPNPTTPFDLIEGEHTAAEGTSYWDIMNIRLR